jgi:hypothetical protein
MSAIAIIIFGPILTFIVLGILFHRWINGVWW